MPQPDLVVAERGVSAMTFGFYGKVPAIGDFVSRDISADQVERLDDWFKAGLAYLQSKQTRWLDDYLVAPVWCFFIPSGIWGEHSLCGALMPSVDRVGRYYPLVAAGAVSQELLAEPVALYHRLAGLAERLPTLLPHNLMPDDILALLHHEDCGWDSIEDDFRVAVERIFLSTRSSYWWVSGHTASCGIEHDVAPDEQLFARLFSAY